MMNWTTITRRTNFRLTLSQWLRSFIGSFALAASLFTVSACAQNAAAPAVRDDSAKTVLQPYLGKWRPTSYSEGLNIGSLTITPDSFSFEVGNSLVNFVFERKTDEGVIVRVTGRKPARAFPELKGLAFLRDTETVKGPPPENIVKTRELLWVCYLSDNPNQIAAGIKKTCGNIYTR